MLLSRSLKLVAAFNHLHIFIDPDPDPQVSFEERQRLFDGPASGWADYDATKISPGGGVFSRRVKSISISPEMQRAFDLPADRLSPDELIHQLLKAPIDLIWNGGIGKRMWKWVIGPTTTCGWMPRSCARGYSAKVATWA
jgi:glutamate dehydrogenase